MNRSHIITALGGAVVVLAAFLVWVSVEVGPNGLLRSDGLATAPGFDQTEGKITLVAGLVIVAAAMALTRGGRISHWAPAIGVAAAIVAAVFMFVTLADLQQKAAAAVVAGSSVSIGIGVWLTGLGAVVALVGFGRSVGDLVGRGDS